MDEIKAWARWLIILVLLAGCASTESMATPVPPTNTPLPPTHTPLPPTATPVPPTDTLVPPTATPASTPTESPPSPTPAPPTPTPQPKIKGKVDVGGYRLFINCIGTGSPTVIMEAGWNDVGDTWHLVQPEIAELTRVCSYDRAGLGNSEPGPEPRTMPQVVAELHTLLENADVEGPYILVGHSWGGSLTRLYTDLYEEEVVGLVLVDSSHPDTARRNLAVLPPESPDDSESLKFYRDWFSSAINDPMIKLDPELYEAGSLGDLPLVVLTAMNKQRADDFPADLNAKFNEIWLELQNELAQLSSNSTHIVSQESEHYIQEEQPDLVIDAILQVIEEVRH
jgi:pimeloyl-ACP methyl ester carboxylesterase